MSVISVKEDDSVRTNTLSVDAHTATRRYTVLTDDPADGPVVARQATGIPRIGDAYPGVSSLLVTSLDARNVGASRVYFEVTVNYSTQTSSFSLTGDPLDEPADISWGTASSVEPVDEDGDGNAIVNSANEGFDPPVTDEFDDPVLTITRNEAAFSPETIVTYKGAVNGDIFYGAQPGEAKMVDLRAQRVMAGATVAYWRVTYVIQFRRYHPNTTAARAWWKRVLNQGFKARPSANAEPETPLDANSNPFNAPVLLATDGTKLADGADAVYLEFKPPRWRMVTFATLGLE